MTVFNIIYSIQPQIISILHNEDVIARIQIIRRHMLMGHMLEANSRIYIRTLMNERPILLLYEGIITITDIFFWIELMYELEKAI
jgi:hypothetical protein